MLSICFFWDAHVSNNILLTCADSQPILDVCIFSISLEGKFDEMSAITGNLPLFKLWRLINYKKKSNQSPDTHIKSINSNNEHKGFILNNIQFAKYFKVLRNEFCLLPPLSGFKDCCLCFLTGSLISLYSLAFNLK